MHRRVAALRKRRAWSVREAGLRGGVSNETWGRYEKSGHLTNKMRAAIAQAFGWDEDWPERPPVELIEVGETNVTRLDDWIEFARRKDLDVVASRLDALEGLANDALRNLDRLSERLELLEGAVARLHPSRPAAR